jgi:hypothetical protein
MRGIFIEVKVNPPIFLRFFHENQRYQYFVFFLSRNEHENELASSHIQVKKFKSECDSLKAENERVVNENKDFRIRFLEYNKELKRKT